MAHTTQYLAQYRDADASGRVGALGLLGMLQVAVLDHARALGLDHDHMVRRRSIGWMFTRYRTALVAKAEVGAPVTLTTWITGTPGARFMNHEVALVQGEKPVAWGRVESCFYDIEGHRVLEPAVVGLPDSAWENGLGHGAVGPWRQLPREIVGATRVFEHTVRYTDLDSLGHMTNLRYPGLVIDAFDGATYARRSMGDMEIHFLAQCFEGDRLALWRQGPMNPALLAVLDDAGLPRTIPTDAAEKARRAAGKHLESQAVPVLVGRDGDVVAQALVRFMDPDVPGEKA